MTTPLPKLWIFVFFGVSALILAIILTGPDLPEPAPASTPVPAEQMRVQTFEQMLQTGDSAIFVENQGVGQESVMVGYVVLAEPGFVVVFDDNDGVPGEVMGASSLLEQGGEYVQVGVNQPLEEGQVYYAMLVQDNGDGQFDLEKDRQVLDAQDVVVLMSFTAKTGLVPEASPIAS